MLNLKRINMNNFLLFNMGKCDRPSVSFYWSVAFVHGYPPRGEGEGTSRTSIDVPSVGL